MKRINDIWILIIGILFVLLSYSLDAEVKFFFESVKLPVPNIILGVITNFGFVIAVTLLIPTVILFNKKRRAAYLLIVTFCAATLITFLIKLIVLRQRPFETITYPFTNIIDYSFPSMHSVVVFSLMVVLNRALPKHKFFWTAFAFLVAISRLYFGAHFLSDVVSGAFLGYFIGKYLLNLYERGKLWKD